MRLILFLGDSRDSISHRKRTRGAATPTKNFSNAIAIPASLMRASICDQQVRLSRRPTAVNLAHGPVGVADTAGAGTRGGGIFQSREWDPRPRRRRPSRPLPTAVSRHPGMLLAAD